MRKVNAEGTERKKEEKMADYCGCYYRVVSSGSGRRRII